MSCDELLLSTDYRRLLIQAVYKTPFTFLLGLRVNGAKETLKALKKRGEERQILRSLGAAFSSRLFIGTIESLLD